MTLHHGAVDQASAKSHFALFGLAPKFNLDLAALESAWKAVQSAVHPDRFAGASDAQRRLALQWSTQINEAHDTHKDPVRRAAYLCHLQGIEIDAERNTAMPAEFLMQQMEWREAMDVAKEASDLEGLNMLSADVAAAITEAHLLLEHLMDGAAADYLRAAEEVRRLMFLSRFQSQVRDEQRRLAHGLTADR